MKPGPIATATEDLQTYEDQFGPLTRRMARALRWMTWAAKGVFRLPRAILVEIRWRLGDEVMALPVYRGLSEMYPRECVHVWCWHPELLDDYTFVESVDHSLS